MTTNEQNEAFEKDLRALVNRYRQEFTLTLGQVVGILNVTAIQLTFEQITSGGSMDDTYNNAKDKLDGVQYAKDIIERATQMPPEPPMAPGGSLDDLEEPKPVLDPVYAKCEECGWPGGPFATKDLAKAAHDEHAPICFTPTKLWSLPPETRAFIESGEPLPTPPAPDHVYGPCPDCGWPGGAFDKQWQAVDSHRQQKSRHELEAGTMNRCMRRTSTLQKKG